MLGMIERGMVRAGLLQAADGEERSQGERLCILAPHNHWPQLGRWMGRGGGRGNTQDQGQEYEAHPLPCGQPQHSPESQSSAFELSDLRRE